MASNVTHGILDEAQLADVLPVNADSDGVVRVGGTRVRLETVLSAFDAGCVAEEILLKYPSLDLGDIYAVLAAYVRHPAAFRPYLDARQEQIERVDREIESRYPASEARQRLLARRKAGA